MRRYAPACRRGVWFARAFARIAPASDDECGDTALTRAELKAPGSIEGETRDFTDDTGEAATFEAFLHRRKNVAVLPGLAEDHAIGVQADPRQSGRKEIASAQAP
jgi:hypothetical protein